MSKSMSLLGLIIALVFLVIGFTIAIPKGDKFGIFLTFLAGLFSLFYAYNLLGGRGVTLFDIDVRAREGWISPDNDFDARLRKLAMLKQDGLITEEEFVQKRQEIMAERW